MFKIIIKSNVTTSVPLSVGHWLIVAVSIVALTIKIYHHRIE